MNRKKDNGIEKENQSEGLYIFSNKKFHGRRNLLIIVIFILALVMAAFLMIPGTISKNNYEKGIQAILDDDYGQAIIYFEKSDVEEASDQVNSINCHQNALRAYEDHNYLEAYEEALLVFGDYPRYSEVWELGEKALSTPVIF